MANLLLVSASTDLTVVSTAIAVFIRNTESVVLLAIGLGSLPRTVTAITMARLLLAPDGLNVAFVTELVDLDSDGNERTALRVFAGPPAVPLRSPSSERNGN